MSKKSPLVCPWWFLPTFDNPLRRLLQPPEPILAGLVQPGDCAADLGCGMGYFTIPMARIVGESGWVAAIDLQSQMLQGVRRRAERAGLAERIHLLQAHAGNPLPAPPALVDFSLVFWMLHEVPDPKIFLNQIYTFTKPGGRMLLVEPLAHVSASAFQRSLDTAAGCGFYSGTPRDVWFSRAVLFSR